MERSSRFTLVELMIVVAIISILAAIAIPELEKAQLSAKRAEAPVNVDGIMVATRAYDATFDVWLSSGLPAIPVGTYGKSPRPWPAGGTVFHTLGWSPDGNVRGAYVTLDNAIGGTLGAYGYVDVDGDSFANDYFTVYDYKNDVMITEKWEYPLDVY